MTPEVHRTAAEGFVCPDVYEQGRPSYPAEAIDALSLTAAMRVADVGCGTGKLTRLLTRTDADVIGIEPLPEMLSAFHALLPDVPVVRSVAEALPFADGSIDVVACASAFHWFDHARVVPEFHRVLREQGRLVCIWNRRDALAGWAHDFWNLTEEYRGDTPGYRSSGWRDAITTSGLFGPITELSFRHVQRTDVDGVVARVASVSFIQTLPEREREHVLARARTFITTHPETKDAATIELPYRTAVYVTERL